MGGIRGGGNFWFVRTPVRTLLGVAFMVRAFLFLFFLFTGHHRGGVGGGGHGGVESCRVGRRRLICHLGYPARGGLSVTKLDYRQEGALNSSLGILNI